MWALPVKVLKPLPSLTYGLPILLSKEGDVYPQLRSLAKWDVLAEEGFGESFPSSERVGLLILQPVTNCIL